MGHDLKIDFARLAQEQGLKIARPGERHYREGWVCLKCPFCSGKAGNHLGFNPRANVFTCFRCGRHGKYETVGLLLNVDKGKAYDLCKKYALNVWEQERLENDKRKNKSFTPKKGKDKFLLPGTDTPMRMHTEYLENRSFDTLDLISVWGIKFTHRVGEYAYRVVIPITYKNRVVSFTTRDVTNQAQDRYLACPPSEALRHHKDCVYGLDQSTYKTCIVVEGPFDVWRIGVGAVCTFGTGYTHTQAKLIASRFEKSYILFDPEEKEAAQRAEGLSQVLSGYPKHKSLVITLSDTNGKDIADLTDRECKPMRKLLR